MFIGAESAMRSCAVLDFVGAAPEEVQARVRDAQRDATYLAANHRNPKRNPRL